MIKYPDGACAGAVAAMAGFISLLIVTPVFAESSLKFDFGSGADKAGYTHITEVSAYNKKRGYGFENTPLVKVSEHSITSDTPFLFSVAVPEGNYNVTVTFGDLKGESGNTVKAEARRLMLEHVKTTPGQFESAKFTVN